MSPLRLRNAALIALSLVFLVAFAIIVVPPLAERHDFNVIAALGDGFVNPFSAGYSLDIFFTYGVLAVWVVHEAVTLQVRRGWIALLLGGLGVVIGIAAYLIIRDRQLRTEPVATA